MTEGLIIKGKTPPADGTSPIKPDENSVVPSADLAKAKVIDIEDENSRHLVRAASLASIPLMLRFGIVSHDYAQSKLGIKLASNMPTSQTHLRVTTGANGLDLISVFDPQQDGKKVSIKKVIETAELLHNREGRFRHPAYVLLSDKVRTTEKYHPVPEQFAAQQSIHKVDSSTSREINGDNSPYGKFFPYEAYIADKVEPGEIEGLIVEPDSITMPATDYITRIFAAPILSPMTWRQLFASTPFEDQSLNDLRSYFLSSQANLRMLLLSLAEKNGFNPKQDRPRDFFSYLPHINFPYPQNRMQVETSPGEDFSFSVDTQEHIQGYRIAMQQLNDKLEAQRGFTPVDNVRGTDSLQLMREILDERVRRYDIEKQIWATYIEGYTKKPIEESTVRDFLNSIASQASIPFYDTSGKVLWPE